MKKPHEGQRPGMARAVAFAGSQARLGVLCGAKQQRVWQWLHGKRLLSAEWAIAIERATGGKVGRGELRPDLWPPG